MGVSVLRHRAAGAGEEPPEDEGHAAHHGAAHVVRTQLHAGWSFCMIITCSN